VAIDGDTIVAGARNDGNANQGAAYTFASTGAASRTEASRRTASTVAAGDQLGTSVAIDGDTIVAGAPFDNIGAESSQGSASVFYPALPVDPPLVQPTPSVDRFAPSLTGARLSRRRFRAGRASMLSYRLSEAAKVTIRVERKLRGRRVRRNGRTRCVKQTRGNVRRRRCARYKRTGSFTRNSTAGATRIKFSGRIGGRKLRPGSYRLTLIPIDAAGNRGAPRRVSFRIVG
jgi:hypothetical protein